MRLDVQLIHKRVRWLQWRYPPLGKGMNTVAQESHDRLLARQGSMKLKVFRVILSIIDYIQKPKEPKDE